MKKLLIIILILLLIPALYLGYLYATNKISDQQITDLKNNVTSGNFNLNQVDTKQIEPFTEDANKQLETLTTRAEEVNEHITKVLGDSVQVNEEEKEKNLSEKAFDYGRYLYCKQVVDEFEKK